MNIIIFVSALIMLAIAGTHIYLGETPRLKPLRGLGQPDLTGAAANVVWHGISLTLLAMAIGLFWLTWNMNIALAVFVSVLSSGFASLFVWYGLTRLRSLRPMPQWVLFLLVPVLVLIGSV